MRAIAKPRRGFIASTRGIAAVEFAILLPVLVLLFLASVDAGRAIAIYMKVRAAAYTLDAITNQFTTLDTSGLSTITNVTLDVLAPYSPGPAVLTISQISVNSSTNATVSWSYSLNGTALTQGASVTVPSGLTTCSTYPCYLIFSQVNYSYSPLFGYFTPAAINLTDSLYVTPRNSECILYGTVTTCASSSSGSGGSGSGGSGSGGSGSGGSGSGGSGSGGSGSGGSGSGGWGGWGGWW